MSLVFFFFPHFVSEKLVLLETIWDPVRVRLLFWSFSIRFPLLSKVTMINPIAYWGRYTRDQRLRVTKREQPPRGTT